MSDPSARFSRFLPWWAYIMNTKNTRGLTSVIIPCWNQLEFTRQCIRALKTHTRPPWELIVIDNGSTDHTGTYLAGVQDGSTAPVTVITNTTNRGFPAAINQGLKVARGEYLVLLNNDVVVTDSWLEQLVALADMPGLGRHMNAGSGAGPGELRIACEEAGRPPVGSGAGSGDPAGRAYDAGRPAFGFGAGSGDPSHQASCAADPERRWLVDAGRPTRPRLSKGGKCSLPSVSMRSGYVPARSASSARCPTMRRRRSSSRTCPIMTCRPCTRLPGGGATSIGGSGSPRTSCRGFAC